MQAANLIVNLCSRFRSIDHPSVFSSLLAWHATHPAAFRPRGRSRWRRRTRQSFRSVRARSRSTSPLVSLGSIARRPSQSLRSIERLDDTHDQCARVGFVNPLRRDESVRRRDSSAAACMNVGEAGFGTAERRRSESCRTAHHSGIGVERPKRLQELLVAKTFRLQNPQSACSAIATGLGGSLAASTFAIGLRHNPDEQCRDS